MSMLTAERPIAGTDRRALIDRALAFPMDSVLDRYAAEHELPLEVAREHEREVKRFLALCALQPEASYGMAGPVDELWHTFITFTVDYARFCDEVAGRFIHHVPTGPEARDDAEGAAAYERMLAAYEETFGEEPPPECWPRPGAQGAEGSACVPHHGAGDAHAGVACGPA
jgi:hypothetical protein